MKKISIVIIAAVVVLISGVVCAKDKSSDATLKNLGIIPNDFKNFKSSVLKYDLEVENSCTEVEVYAESTNSKAKISGIGNVDLKCGLNKIPVEVEAEDGNKKTYILNINREEGKIEDKKIITSPIKLIEIEDAKLVKNFDSGVFVYDAIYSGTKTELEVKVMQDNKNYTINTIGNDNLEDGNNIITILCTNTEDKTTIIYQINLYKNVAQNVIQTQEANTRDNTVIYVLCGIGITVIIFITIISIKGIIRKVKYNTNIKRSESGSRSNNKQSRKKTR